MRPEAKPLALGVLLAALGLFYGLLSLRSGGDPAVLAEDLRAARTYARALALLKEEAARRGLQPDPALDPERTGLVGQAMTPLTTTLGSLAAKRTGLQPDAAALMAGLLRRGGVRRGGRVAVDSSGSFPGFALATLIAAETLGAQTTCIVSLGSSTYGANRPGFTLADMVTVLVQKGLLRHGLSAVSAGGDDDQGGNLGGPERERALARAGAPVIREPDLGRNLAIRRGFLWSGQRPDLVVSVGGNLTSTGLDETFGPRTGLILPGHRSGAEGSPRGLIQLCLGEAIPVVRILDIRGLCALSGLPYDPIPVPAPGQSGYFRQRAQPPALLAAGVLLAVLLATLAGRWKQAP